MIIVWSDILLELNKIYNMDCLEGLNEIESVNLMITDIPYNISQKSAGLRKLDYGEWDKQDNKDIYDRLFKATEKVKTACYIFCHESQFSTLYNKLKSDDWLVRSLVWLKPNPTVINCDKLYAPSQELIIYAKRRGALYNPKYKKSYFTYSAPTGKKRFHPNQKPLDLVKEFILDSSSEGDLILDPFCGSGTTLIAAKELNRKYIGFETDTTYCGLAEKRIQDIVS